MMTIGVNSILELMGNSKIGYLKKLNFGIDQFDAELTPCLIGVHL